MLEKVADDDLVEGTTTRIWVLGHHFPCVWVFPQGIPSFDEHRQVTQGTVLHNQVNMRCCFMAINESDDMRMIQALEDLDFGVKVLL